MCVYENNNKETCGTYYRPPLFPSSTSYFTQLCMRLNNINMGTRKPHENSLCGAISLWLIHIMLLMRKTSSERSNCEYAYLLCEGCSAHLKVASLVEGVRRTKDRHFPLEQWLVVDQLHTESFESILLHALQLETQCAHGRTGWKCGHFRSDLPSSDCL